MNRPKRLFDWAGANASQCVCAVVLHLGGAVLVFGAAEVEHLGRPCRAKQVLAGRVVVDRIDGRERLVLLNDNESQGAELLFIDFEKDTGKMYPAPAGSGGWALREVSDDRLVVGTFYDGVFMIFDLKKMAFIKTIDFPGQSYIWNLAMGADGRIYGGTYSGAKLGAIDLQTYAFEDLGAPAKPNLYLRHVSATPEGLILCSFGMQKPKVLVFDPGSKKFSPPPPQLEGVSVGVAWNGYFLAGSRVYKGRSFEPVDPPPFPPPPADKGAWSVDTYLTTNGVLFLRQGLAVYRHAKGDKAPTLIAGIDLRGGRLLAGTRKGHVLGIRGQDYFVLRPGDKELKLRRIPVEGRPRPTLFLKADDRGRLWGGPHFGQTLCWLDVRTKKAGDTATICDHSGEVYDVTFFDGKVYAASYSGGDITRYDPQAEWDQWNHENPKPIARVGPAYIRPTGGILVGPDGKLYSGWMARYGTYGGAVAITDPATGQTTRIENPLGEQAVNGLAVDATHAYVGTSLSGNGLPRKPNESARFGMIKLASRKVIFTQEFKGARNVRQVHYDRQTKYVVMLVNETLRVFSPANKQMLALTAESPKITSASIAVPGDGKVYAGSEKVVISINLPDGTTVRLAEVPAKVTNVTVDPDAVVYVSCGEDVYGIKPDADFPR